MAEATARELGRISLEEALALTALIAEKEPERRSRFAVRWLRRLLEEDERLSIEEAAEDEAEARMENRLDSIDQRHERLERLLGK